MATMKAQPDWLTAKFATQHIGVDKENRRINGMVVAQAGNFKDEGRGQFTLASLEKIAALMAQEPNGLKSRLSHSTMSDDGISRYLGRVSNPRLDKATVRRNGQTVQVDAVRGDLQLSDTAFEGNPNGNIGQWVLDLAASDADALSSSLVLTVDKERLLDDKGRPKLDEEGNELPPVWHPKDLHGADLVSVGAAVDGLLSAGVDVDGLPLAALWRGTELLDSVFAGQPPEVIRLRCNAWLERYLSQRGGAAPGSAALHRRLRLAEMEARREG